MEYEHIPRGVLVDENGSRCLLPAFKMKLSTLVAIKWSVRCVGCRHQSDVQIGEQAEPQALAIEDPTTWLSAVTFRATDADGHPNDAIYPNQIVVHVNHTGSNSIRFKSLRLWLPDEGADPHVFRLAHEFDQLTCFPADGTLTGASKGGVVVKCNALPRSYAVVKVQIASGSNEVESLWGFLKIKPEMFDISGGWIASDINGRNSLTIDDYVMTLSRMHVSTGQIEEVSG